MHTAFSRQCDLTIHGIFRALLLHALLQPLRKVLVLFVFVKEGEELLCPLRPAIEILGTYRARRVPKYLAQWGKAQRLRV